MVLGKKHEDTRWNILSDFLGFRSTVYKSSGVRPRIINSAFIFRSSDPVSSRSATSAGRILLFYCVSLLVLKFQNEENKGGAGSGGRPYAVSC